MNSKERVRRAFHFEKPDRIPMSCMNLSTDFFPVSQFQPKTWQPREYPPHIPGGIFNLAKKYYRLIIYDWDKKNRNDLGFEKKWWKKAHISINEWGVLWKSSGTEGEDLTKGHPFKGPLQDSWDYLDDYQIPDSSDPKRYRLVKTKLWKLLGKNRYTVGELSANGFFNLCSQIRGFNNVLIDFARNPHKLEILIKKIFPFFYNQIEGFKKYFPNLNSIIVADDFGTQHSPFISPQIFSKFFKKAYKDIINLTHDLEMDFILHSCGQILELMPNFVKIGVDVFEFDSPLMTGILNIKNFAENRKCAFWLSSNIQSTYTNGNPEDIEDEIKFFIKNIGNYKGGLSIYEYPSNRVLGTPKENIIAQRNAVKKWGKYNDNGIIEWLN
ncbi:MAG: uroporphyrinogen decarboxylase family protein [Promethearchaeota archaeon]